jgi:hypothetical protein
VKEKEERGGLYRERGRHVKNRPWHNVKKGRRTDGRIDGSNEPTRQKEREKQTMEKRRRLLVGRK